MELNNLSHEVKKQFIPDPAELLMGPVQIFEFQQQHQQNQIRLAREEDKKEKNLLEAYYKLKEKCSKKKAELDKIIEKRKKVQAWGLKMYMKQQKVERVKQYRDPNCSSPSLSISTNRSSSQSVSPLLRQCFKSKSKQNFFDDESTSLSNDSRYFLIKITNGLLISCINSSSFFNQKNSSKQISKKNTQKSQANRSPFFA